MEVDTAIPGKSRRKTLGSPRIRLETVNFCAWHCLQKLLCISTIVTSDFQEKRRSGPDKICDLICREVIAHNPRYASHDIR